MTDASDPARRATWRLVIVLVAFNFGLNVGISTRADEPGPGKTEPPAKTESSPDPAPMIKSSPASTPQSPAPGSNAADPFIPATNAPAAATQPESQPPSEAVSPADDYEVRRGIAALDDPDFHRREQAMAHLVTLGKAAIPRLKQAARDGSPEASTRAIRVLYDQLRRGDDRTSEAAEDALEALMSDRHPLVASRSRTALGSQELLRYKRAISRLQFLGAKIKFTHDAGRALIENRETGVAEGVILKKSWRGGDEGLALLRRISTLRILYVIDGAGVSDEALQALGRDLPALTIDRRSTALLGVNCMDAALGCEVHKVEPGSAADEANLVPGDVIVSFDDVPVKNFQHLIGMTKKHQAGDRVVLEIRRNGEKFLEEVTLHEW